MRYLLMLLIFSACTKNKGKQASIEQIKGKQDPIIYRFSAPDMGSNEKVSDSSYIYRIIRWIENNPDKNISEFAKGTTIWNISENDSISYTFDDSTLMYGENVPRHIVHDHSDAKACTACKLRNAYINVWKNY